MSDSGRIGNNLAADEALSLSTSIGEGSGPFTWPDVETAQAAAPGNFNLYNPSYRGEIIVARSTLNELIAKHLHRHIPKFALVHRTDMGRYSISDYLSLPDVLSLSHKVRHLRAYQRVSMLIITAFPSYHLQAGMAVLLAEGLDVGRPEVPEQV